MKKQLIHILLLLSLFFNIAHDSVIAIENDSHQESVHEYTSAQINTLEGSHTCDTHHLFHFMAIIDEASIYVFTPTFKVQSIHQNMFYTPPFKETTIKPPIA